MSYELLARARSDASLGAGRQRHVVVAGDRDICRWCKTSLPPGSRRDAIFCGKRCRQSYWRFARQCRVVSLGSKESPLDLATRPMVFAYADPPYPGKAHYYPEKTEVNHASLLQRLTRDYPDGWALSTSARSVRDILDLCPKDIRLCAWFKGPRTTVSLRPLVSWEALIVYGGRPMAISDVCRVADGLVARGRFRGFPGAMVGMKPPAFAAWMFAQLGATPLDTLVDLFPGSGAISRAWEIFKSQ